MSRAARELVRKNPGLAPGLALVAVLAIWSHRDGGYAVVDWAPGAIFVLALALIVLLLAPGSFGRTVPLVVTTSFLAAFTLWSYLTIGWAEVQANAWTGANRTLLYLVVFVLMTARPWSSAGASVFLGAYAMGVWAVSMVAFGRAVDLTDVSLAFREGRLAVPISYSNASCALFISAALPALHLAARREVPAVLRGAFLAAAGTLVELVLLTQSRASLVILPVMAVLWVLIVPGRVRSVVALFTVTAVVGVSAPWHLDVYRAVLSETDAGSVLERSLVVVASSAIVLFALGTVWGWLDSRIEVSPRVTRVSGRALTGLTASVVVIAVAVAAASVSNPGARASAAWDHFRNEQYVSDAETPHLASGFGSGRWKIWTVAVDQFAESPVIGAGGDNFGVDYLRERQDQAQPLHPHSIELRTLSQTGIVGSLLLLGFLASAAWAVLSNARGATPYTLGLVGISGLVFCYWLDRLVLGDTGTRRAGIRVARVGHARP
jgi:O-Antigen ligase